MSVKRSQKEEEQVHKLCVTLMSSCSEEKWSYYEGIARELGAMDEFKRIKEDALKYKEEKESK